MSNVKPFRHPHPEAPVGPPDAEKLQRLLGQLVEPAPQQDREIRIRNFRSVAYELMDDLLIVLEERDGGEFVATSFDTGQYGHGYSPDAAIHHLCSVLEDYYELLSEDEGHLSERLDGHLRYLRSVLRERK